MRPKRFARTAPSCARRRSLRRCFPPWPSGLASLTSCWDCPCFCWRSPSRRPGQGSVSPNATLLQLPFVLLLLTAAIFGFALAISALAVHFGDVRDLVANLLTLAFFLTPVLYPVASVPERFRPYLWANPFASFFAGVHDSAFGFRWIPAGAWAGMAATAVVSLVLGGWIFERLRDSIAEEA